MRSHFGHAVGHTYAHGSWLHFSTGAPEDISECEDVDLVLNPSDHGELNNSGLDSHSESELTVLNSTMDINDNEEDNAMYASE